MTMRSLIAAIAVLTSACSADPCTDEGVACAGGCAITQGAGSATVADYGYAFTSSGFQLDGVGSQDANGYGVDSAVLAISFEFSDASAADAKATLTCGPVLRSALVAATRAVALTDLCDAKLVIAGPMVDPELGGCCGNLVTNLTDGTLTVVSRLDGDGNGPMSIQLDIPDTTVAGYDASTSSSHDVHIVVNALLGASVAAPHPINSPECQGLSL